MARQVDLRSSCAMFFCGEIDLRFSARTGLRTVWEEGRKFWVGNQGRLECRALRVGGREEEVTQRSRRFTERTREKRMNGFAWGRGRRMYRDDVDLEIGDTADLEICATSPRENFEGLLRSA
jgi:hypothetical protein